MDFSNVPSTSQYRCLSENEKKEEEKKRKKEELKAYHKSLVSSEREKLKNADKIRLRRLPRIGNRPLHIAAMRILNHLFNTQLTPDDIVDCQRVPSWSGPEPTDLVITFRDRSVRDYVYNRRTKENRGTMIVCDELGEERLEIWRQLKRKYGSHRVYTHCGAVHLDFGGKYRRFLTLSELKKFQDEFDDETTDESD